MAATIWRASNSEDEEEIGILEKNGDVVVVVNVPEPCCGKIARRDAIPVTPPASADDTNEVAESGLLLSENDRQWVIATLVPNRTDVVAAAGKIMVEGLVAAAAATDEFMAPLVAG